MLITFKVNFVVFNFRSQWYKVQGCTEDRDDGGNERRAGEIIQKNTLLTLADTDWLLI